MDRLVFLLGTGLARGAVLALFALALVLIWRGARVVNFAQGAMAVVSTYVAFEVTSLTGSYWLGLLAALLAGGLLGFAVERGVMRFASPASPLSGGERQMLVLGRALMARPRLLLLDEPSLGLAPRVAAQIVGLLQQLRERDGLTVLLVEQNARSALSVADQGVVLALGKVVAAENPEQLRHAYLGF